MMATKNKKRTGKRLQHMFWLDQSKGPVKKLYDQFLKISEKALHLELEILKGQRQFSAAMREGCVIWIEAMQGRTDYLEKRFPGLVQAIVSRHQNRQIDELQQQLRQLQNQLDAMSLGSQPLMFTPVSEIEDVEPITPIPLAPDNAMQNFMSSLMGLQ